MQYVTLGKSGLRVSEIALGTARFWDDQHPEMAVSTIRKARDFGINFFDTARTYGYGHSEEILAAALHDDLRRHRDEVVIATKGGLQMTPEGARRDASPAKLREDLEASLMALGVDVIDLYHVHWPDPNVPFSETAGVLGDLVTEGKIRHVGLSNFDAMEVERFSSTLAAEVLQPAYHLFGRDVENDLLPYAGRHDLGVLVYGVLGHGLLGGSVPEPAPFPPEDWRSHSPMYQGDAYEANLGVVRELQRLASDALGCSIGQLAVAWVLAHPAVHVAIVGTSRADHLQEAIFALETQLDPALLVRIDEIMMSARPSPGPTPESTPPA